MTRAAAPASAAALLQAALAALAALAARPAAAFGPAGGAFPTLFVPTASGSLNATLDALPSSAKHLLLEFYAPWCPHCRHFAHDVERLGFTFNREPTPVSVARVDCVADAALCSRLGVDGYPTLKWASPAAWRAYPGVEALGRAARERDAAAAAAGHDSLRDRQRRAAGDAAARDAFEAAHNVTTVQAGHTAEDVFAWVAARAGRGGAMPAKVAPPGAFESALTKAARELPVYLAPDKFRRVDLEDVDLVTAVALHTIFEDELSLDALRRGHLARFVRLLCENYPRKACRPSLCDLAGRLSHLLELEDRDADDNDDEEVAALRRRAEAEGKAAPATQKADPRDDYDDQLGNLDFPIGQEAEKPLPGEKPGEDVLAKGWAEPHTYPLAEAPPSGGAQTMAEAQRAAERARGADVGMQGIAAPIVDPVPADVQAQVAKDWRVPVPPPDADEDGAVSLLQVQKPRMVAATVVANATGGARPPPYKKKLQGAALFEHEWQFCNRTWKDVGAADWHACKGTFPYLRGYTCGLWSLFHSLAGQFSSADAAAGVMGIRDFVGAFFACTDCRDHFEDVTYDAPKLVHNARDGVLFLWRVHNGVNERVRALESAHGDGDPAFPKRPFPPPELCPLCRRAAPRLANAGAAKARGRADGALAPGAPAPLSGDAADAAARGEWDLDVVYDFLSGYYGTAKEGRPGEAAARG